jgi:hypothetical protein
LASWTSTPNFVDHPAVGVIARIQAPVGVVPREGELPGPPTFARRSGGHDPAIGQQGHGVGRLESGTEIGRHHPARPETRVEAAVRVEPGQPEDVDRYAGDHDLAIGLERHREDGEIADGHRAADTEGGIEVAGRCARGRPQSDQ